MAVFVLQFTAFADQVVNAQNPVFKEVSIDELKIHIERSDAIILDARPSVFYELGHIRTAYSLSIIDFAENFPALLKSLKLQPDSKIIVYCADKDCDDSIILAKKLTAKNIQNISIFKGGWKTWMSIKEGSQK